MDCSLWLCSPFSTPHERKILSFCSQIQEDNVYLEHNGDMCWLWCEREEYSWFCISGDALAVKIQVTLNLNTKMYKRDGVYVVSQQIFSMGEAILFLHGRIFICAWMCVVPLLQISLLFSSLLMSSSSSHVTRPSWHPHSNPGQRTDICPERWQSEGIRVRLSSATLICRWHQKTKALLGP